MSCSSMKRNSSRIFFWPGENSCALLSAPFSFPWSSIAFPIRSGFPLSLRVSRRSQPDFSMIEYSISLFLKIPPLRCSAIFLFFLPDFFPGRFSNPLSFPAFFGRRGRDSFLPLEADLPFCSRKHSIFLFCCFESDPGPRAPSFLTIVMNSESLFFSPSFFFQTLTFFRSAEFFFSPPFSWS